MLELCKKNIREQIPNARVEFAHANYSESPFRENAPFDIVLLDLGISSLHLENFSRGISYKTNEILDMRLDQASGIPAHAWLRQANEKEIADVLYHYGEEYLAKRIARGIISQQKKGEVKYMDELKDICVRVYTRAGKLVRRRHTTRHPYVKTLQAIRIHTNQELDHLEKAMSVLPDALKKGGRLFVISFHSLEDRIVKHGFLKLTKKTDGQSRALFKICTKKPIQPREEEVMMNPRARSAKMRILERAV